jgi:hypothetical protein
MTIKSEIYKGKIYAGGTELACNIAIEQTGPLQLTVNAGTFTHTDGKAWTLAVPTVFDVPADPTHPTECKIEIGDIGGVADVWCASRLLDGIEEFDTPPGWNSGHVLAFPFVVPAGCVDLANVDIFVLTVLPGFPDGTTAADWQVQSGGA